MISASLPVSSFPTLLFLCFSCSLIPNPERIVTTQGSEIILFHFFLLYSFLPKFLSMASTIILIKISLHSISIPNPCSSALLLPITPLQTSENGKSYPSINMLNISHFYDLGYSLFLVSAISL
jgi:hypothetical protein